MNFDEIKTINDIFKGGFGIEWNKKTYRDVIQSISKREEANWEWEFLETDIGYISDIISE